MNISWKCLRNAAIFSLILWVLIFWGVPACRGGEWYLDATGPYPKITVHGTVTIETTSGPAEMDVYHIDRREKQETAYDKCMERCLKEYAGFDWYQYCKWDCQQTYWFIEQHCQKLRERVEALEKKWEGYEGWKFTLLPSIIRTELNDLSSPRTPDAEDLTDGRPYSTTPDWPSIAPQTLEIKWTDDGQCYKQYSWGYVTVPCPKTLSIEWLGHLVVSVEGAADKVYSMQGLSNYEIGLLSKEEGKDYGVVVWREVEK